MCVTDYETQTERSIAEGADSEQNQLVDEDGELIEDYRFLCLSTQYFRGLSKTETGLYAVCELTTLTEIDENAVECQDGYVSKGLNEGSALTSRQVECESVLEYVFDSFDGKEEIILSNIEIKDDCKNGYYLTKGTETTLDWGCGVNSLSVEGSKALFCGQNSSFKICENGFDFVSEFDGPFQTFVAGAGGNSDGGIYRGAVYIFERNLFGNFTQTLKISDNVGGAELLDISLNNYNRFGSSVSYSDDTLAVGAANDGNVRNQRGAVYIFEKDSNEVWSQTLKISNNSGGAGLLNINLEDNDRFGSSVSILDDVLVVGAYEDDDGGLNKGAVYIFEKDSNGEWSQTLKISDNGDGAGKLDINLNTADEFGTSISYSDDLLVVGADRDDYTGGLDRGAVYIFEKDSNGEWSKTLKISDNGGDGTNGKLGINLDNFDYFGTSISYSDDTLAVGARGNDDVGIGGISRGAVYIFEKSSGVWSQTLKISNNSGGTTGLLNIDLNDRDEFGSSVSYLDGTLVVGTDNGEVFVFEKDLNGVWSQTLNISSNDAGDYFGSGVFLSDI